MEYISPGVKAGANPSATSWHEADFSHWIQMCQQLYLSACLCKMAEHSKCMLKSLRIGVK